jgi:hypothetical protein
MEINCFFSASDAEPSRQFVVLCNFLDTCNRSLCNLSMNFLRR